MAARKKTAKKATRKKTTRKKNTEATGGGVSAAMDRKYQAESDARTLAEAEAIRTNKSRLGRATTEIRKQRDALENALKPS